MLQYIILYLIGINLISLLMMKVDKTASKKKNKQRIPEKTLLFTALIGGSAGATIGMFLFRHKTRKFLFKVGFPGILVLQTIGLLYYLVYV